MTYVLVMWLGPITRIVVIITKQLQLLHFLVPAGTRASDINSRGFHCHKPVYEPGALKSRVSWQAGMYLLAESSRQAGRHLLTRSPLARRCVLLANV
jgi:hypothetical protein